MEYTAPPMRPPLLALCAVILVGTLALLATGTPVSSTLVITDEAQIGVEHAGSAVIRVVRSVSARGVLVKFAGIEGQNAAITIPEHWHLREARGETIEALRSHSDSSAFARWKLPPNVSLSFVVERPERMRVYNASSGTLLIKDAQIRENGKVEENDVLMNADPVLLD